MEAGSAARSDTFTGIRITRRSTVVDRTRPALRTAVIRVIRRTCRTIKIMAGFTLCGTAYADVTRSRVPTCIAQTIDPGFTTFRRRIRVASRAVYRKMIVCITTLRAALPGTRIARRGAVGNRTHSSLFTAVIRVIWFARRAIEVIACLTICGFTDRSIT